MGLGPGVEEPVMTGTEGPRPYVNPMEAGPAMRPPWAAYWAALAAATVVALVGWGAFAWFKPASAWGVWPGWGAVAGAFLLGMLAMRPWIARPVGRLLMVWLAGRGVCFVGVILLGALLYFAPHSRPDPLAMGLALASSYFAALLAESAVMSRRLRAAAHTSTESGPTHGSVSRG